MFKKIRKKRQIKRAIKMANNAKSVTNKQHIVILTQDGKIRVLDRSGLKQINRARIKANQRALKWSEVVGQAIYKTES